MNRHLNGLNGKLMTDHTGKTFDSEVALCKYWGIARQTFQSRRNAGLSMRDALTIKTRINSIGEMRVADILDELGVTYFHDKTLKAVAKILNLGDDFSEYGNYRYDFIIYYLRNLYCIEYDGQHHFTYVPKFHEKLTDVITQHDADLDKDFICEAEEIPFLRIRYDMNSYDEIKYQILDLLDDDNDFYLYEHNRIGFIKYYEEFMKYEGALLEEGVM